MQAVERYGKKTKKFQNAVDNTPGKSYNNNMYDCTVFSAAVSADGCMRAALMMIAL